MENLIAPIAAFFIGMVIPMVFASYLPNTKFRTWGQKVGRAMSAKGRKLGGADYEKVENNLTGSFVSFAQGLQEGADEDDAQ